jgi:hypothetical protein
VFACACLALSSQAAAQMGDQPDPSPPKRVVLAAPVDVPLTLVNGLPIVETRINGQGPFRFGIETGANFVLISPDVATKLALKRTGGPDVFPAYRVETIAIGDATFADMPVSAGRVAQTGIDGVLGLPLYRDVLLTIDYPRQRVRIEKGELPAADGATVLPLTHAGPFWALPMKVAGQSVAAIIDTRSTGAFGFTPDAAARITFSGELRLVGRARGAAIAETEIKAGRLAGDITIGRYVFPTPMGTVRPLPPGFPSEPLIGARVLNQFVVTLDQRNARVRLARDAAGPIVLDEPTATVPGATDYAGTYGTRQVRAVDGGLQFQREGGAALDMVPTGKDTFTLKQAPQAKIEFVRDPAGAVVAMKILTSEGQWETLAKR